MEAGEREERRERDAKRLSVTCLGHLPTHEASLYIVGVRSRLPCGLWNAVRRVPARCSSYHHLKVAFGPCLYSPGA